MNKKREYHAFFDDMTIIICSVTTLYKLKKTDQIFWNCNDKPINNLCSQKNAQTNVDQEE